MASCSRMPASPAQYHGHFTGRRGAGVQVGEAACTASSTYLAQSGHRQNRPAQIAHRRRLSPLRDGLLLGNHGHDRAHQRAHIGRQRAVGTGDQHHVVFSWPGRPSPAPRAGLWRGPVCSTLLQQAHLGWCCPDVDIGSSPRYSERLPAIFLGRLLALYVPIARRRNGVRTVRAASSSEASEISSE
jgi:hypothetical protein